MLPFSRHLHPLVSWSLLVAGNAAASFLLTLGIVNVNHVDGTMRELQMGAGVVAWMTVLSYFTTLRPYYVRDIKASTAAADARNRLKADARRQEFDARLHRGLELADHEHEALAVVTRALGLASSEHPSELLLADSSRAHLARVAEHPDGGGPDCQVASPNGCAAVRRGQTVIFGSGNDLDACPHLRNRPDGDCSAACVPVTILGSTVGVLHTTGPSRQPPSGEVVAGLEAIANQAGARIGMIRALARSQVQASTDPLTGLLNRRSLEESLRPVLDAGRRYSVIMADLDHFKLLNDTYGHDTGDRALRLFAGVIQRSLRPGDLACRHGGEEFVLVLPDCDAIEAEQVADRLRETLALSHVNGTTPSFTASFGIADSAVHGDEFDILLNAADVALLDAKRAGRDRIILAHA